MRGKKLEGNNDQELIEKQATLLKTENIFKPPLEKKSQELLIRLRKCDTSILVAFPSLSSTVGELKL